QGTRIKKAPLALRRLIEKQAISFLTCSLSTSQNIAQKVFESRLRFDLRRSTSPCRPRSAAEANGRRPDTHLRAHTHCAHPSVFALSKDECSLLLSDGS